MFDDLTNSMKARLWDFKYTPFMSSYVIFFIFFNREYLMIYFTDISFIEKKRLILESIDINWQIPLCYAVIYVFAYPAVFYFFYGYTLLMNVWTNKLKQKIEKQKLISVGESIQLRIDMDNKDKEIENFYSTLKNEKLLLEKKEEKLNLTFEEKEKEVDNQIKVLNNEYHIEKNSLKAKIDLLEKELRAEKLKKATPFAVSEAMKNIPKLGETMKGIPNIGETMKGIQRYKQSTGLKEIVENVQKEKENKNMSIINNLSDEEKDFLSVFHKEKSKFSETDLDSILKEKFNFNPGKIDLFISNMEKKELLKYSSPYYHLTDLGLSISNQIFE